MSGPLAELELGPVSRNIAGGETSGRQTGPSSRRPRLYVGAFFRRERALNHTPGKANAVRFWLYGNDNGAHLFFEILDNRRVCSTRDDAERYVFELADDFSGWRQIRLESP